MSLKLIIIFLSLTLSYLSAESVTDKLLPEKEKKVFPDKNAKTILEEVKPTNTNARNGVVPEGISSHVSADSEAQNNAYVNALPENDKKDFLENIARTIRKEVKPTNNDGNTQNDAYINSLPEKDKKEFLENIARTILEEVKTTNNDSAGVKVPESLLDKQTDYVAKVFKDAKERFQKTHNISSHISADSGVQNNAHVTSLPAKDEKEFLGNKSRRSLEEVKSTNTDAKSGMAPESILDKQTNYVENKFKEEKEPLQKTQNVTFPEKVMLRTSEDKDEHQTLDREKSGSSEGKKSENLDGVDKTVIEGEKEKKNIQKGKITAGTDILIESTTPKTTTSAIQLHSHEVEIAKNHGNYSIEITVEGSKGNDTSKGNYVGESKNKGVVSQLPVNIEYSSDNTEKSKVTPADKAKYFEKSNRDKFDDTRRNTNISITPSLVGETQKEIINEIANTKTAKKPVKHRKFKVVQKTKTNVNLKESRSESATDNDKRSKLDEIGPSTLKLYTLIEKKSKRSNTHEDTTVPFVSTVSESSTVLTSTAIDKNEQNSTQIDVPNDMTNIYNKNNETSTVKSQITKNADSDNLDHNIDKETDITVTKATLRDLDENVAKDTKVERNENDNIKPDSLNVKSPGTESAKELVSAQTTRAPDLKTIELLSTVPNSFSETSTVISQVAKNYDGDNLNNIAKEIDKAVTNTATESINEANFIKTTTIETSTVISQRTKNDDGDHWNNTAKEIDKPVTNAASEDLNEANVYKTTAVEVNKNNDNIKSDYIAVKSTTESANEISATQISRAPELKTTELLSTVPEISSIYTTESPDIEAPTTEASKIETSTAEVFTMEFSTTQSSTTTTTEIKPSTEVPVTENIEIKVIKPLTDAPVTENIEINVTKPKSTEVPVTENIEIKVIKASRDAPVTENIDNKVIKPSTDAPVTENIETKVIKPSTEVPVTENIEFKVNTVTTSYKNPTRTPLPETTTRKTRTIIAEIIETNHIEKQETITNISRTKTLKNTKNQAPLNFEDMEELDLYGKNYVLDEHSRIKDNDDEHSQIPKYQPEEITDAELFRSLKEKYDKKNNKTDYVVYEVLNDDDAMKIMQGNMFSPSDIKSKVKDVQPPHDNNGMKMQQAEIVSPSNIKLKLKDVQPNKNGGMKIMQGKIISPKQIKLKVKGNDDSSKILQGKIITPSGMKLQVKEVDDVLRTQNEGLGSPYYVPVYNYAPENAYFNGYNKHGPANGLSNVLLRTVDESLQESPYITTGYDYAPENAYLGEDKYGPVEGVDNDVLRTQKDILQELINAVQPDDDDRMKILLGKYISPDIKLKVKDVQPSYDDELKILLGNMLSSSEVKSKVKINSPEQIELKVKDVDNILKILQGKIISPSGIKLKGKDVGDDIKLLQGKIISSDEVKSIDTLRSQNEGLESLYYVPVYNYAPENAFFNGYNKHGPANGLSNDLLRAQDDGVQEPPYIITGYDYSPENAESRKKILINIDFDTVKEKANSNRYSKARETPNKKNYDDILGKLIPKPNYASNIFIPNLADTMDYDNTFLGAGSFDRSLHRASIKRQRKKIKKPAKKKGFKFPNSGEPEHLWNWLKSKPFNNQMSAVQKLMYSNGFYGSPEKKSSYNNVFKNKSNLRDNNDMTLDKLLAKLYAHGEERVNTTEKHKKKPQKFVSIDYLWRESRPKRPKKPKRPIKNNLLKYAEKLINFRSSLDNLEENIERYLKSQKKSFIREDAKENAKDDDNDNIKIKVDEAELRLIANISTAQDVVPAILALQSMMGRKKKPKPDFESSINVIKDQIKIENKALESYDWLGTAVDIQGALKKLQDLTLSIRNATEEIPAPDLELYYYLVYLYSDAKSKLIEENKLRHAKANDNKPQKSEPKVKKIKVNDFGLFKPMQGRNDEDIRDVIQKDDILKIFDFRRKKDIEVKPLLSFNVQNKKDEILKRNSFENKMVDFGDFLSDTENNIYDFHNAIKHVALVSKNKRKLYKSLKDLYLTNLKDRDALQVLLHLELTKLLELIEDGTKKGLSDNYLSYIENNDDDSKAAIEQMKIVLRITNDIEDID